MSVRSVVDKLLRRQPKPYLFNGRVVRVTLHTGDPSKPISETSSASYARQGMKCSNTAALTFSNMPAVGFYYPDDEEPA